jgi:hypothetical protein
MSRCVQVWFQNKRQRGKTASTELNHGRNSRVSGSSA